MVHGILNVEKEIGFTSFDVVAKLRGILKQKKIGHTGTLDPDARGVLPVCLGNATKLCDMLTEKTKEYEAVMLLGVTTDTLDLSGEVLKEQPVSVSEEEIRGIINGFLGEQQQIPPMYSALKVDGRRLYELAREGKTIERKSRTITIHRIEIVSVELPRVTFRVECSKGTYIRSLCQDIGEKVGCGACMESLIRTRSGAFTIENALTLSTIEQMMKSGRIEDAILPMEAIFEELEALHVTEQWKVRIDNGNPLELLAFEETITPEEKKQYRIYNVEGRFFAIYRYEEEQNRMMPERIFPLE
ncbi:MAG TPA: tRNA pseudouridine(55) synthase TruB [Lachnospiraceae bacterium]|nr:tRNA pseudouridine(55) synthase TruB [Lachnospiraceae bacterium]